VKPERWSRDGIDALDQGDAVVVHDVRDAAGKVAITRGTRLTRVDRERLLGLAWDCLHVVLVLSDDVDEAVAGARLAAAAAGPGVLAGDGGSGHWPLTAAHRGMLSVRVDALNEVNAINGLAVYTLPDEQVVERGETVARAKILPVLVPAGDLHVAESTAEGGLVSVRAFVAMRVAAVVQESLGSSALERFHRSLSEKVEWFGGSLAAMEMAAPDAGPIADAFARVRGAADLVVVAGTRAMDPLDPAFEALRVAGGTIERIGAPAHPGSLFWLAHLGDLPVIGMPSCSLFSRATVFDLALSRWFAGLPVDGAWLSALGHGGLLTRDMSWRFPPYRPRLERGAVE
jgi:hypothetical protein